MWMPHFVSFLDSLDFSVANKETWFQTSGSATGSENAITSQHPNCMLTSSTHFGISRKIRVRLLNDYNGELNYMRRVPSSYWAEPPVGTIPAGQLLRYTWERVDGERSIYLVTVTWQWKCDASSTRPYIRDNRKASPNPFYCSCAEELQHQLYRLQNSAVCWPYPWVDE